MRNPRRDAIEKGIYYFLLSTSVIGMGLVKIFQYDANGNRKKIVFDQPIEESLREAKVEWKEFESRMRKRLDNYMTENNWNFNSSSTRAKPSDNNNDNNNHNHHHNKTKRQTLQDGNVHTATTPSSIGSLPGADNDWDGK